MIYNVGLWESHRWERQDGRYYGAIIEQDLLGQWVLKRIWGGIGKPAGQMKITPCESLNKARSLLKGVSQRRIARQYTKKNEGHYEHTIKN